MSEWTAKRFWEEAVAVERDGGFSVELDARPVKTPAKRALLLPTLDMARAVAAEWDAQDEIIDPKSMPFTRTANAAIDKVALQHAEVAQMLAEYADSDLLCYRADSPKALVDRQAELWNPWLDWASEALGARLAPRSGVVHAPQDAQALAKLSEKVHAFNAFELAALHDLVSLSGSLILAFATAQDAIDVAEAWEISRLDELWQEEQWGKDDEAEAVAALKKEAFLHAKQVFDMSSPSALPQE